MSKISILIVSLFAACLLAGCGNNDATPASAPGPSVGSPTPGGGAVTINPAKGHKPRMAGQAAPATP